MPQFDIYTFSNQVYWLFFFLISFYLYITYFFIPRLATNIKIRKKKIKKDTIFYYNLKFEHIYQLKKLNSFYFLIFSNILDSINKINLQNKLKIKTLKNNILKEKLPLLDISNFLINYKNFPKKFLIK